MLLHEHDQAMHDEKHRMGPGPFAEKGPLNNSIYVEQLPNLVLVRYGSYVLNLQSPLQAVKNVKEHVTKARCCSMHAMHSNCLRSNNKTYISNR